MNMRGMHKGFDKYSDCSIAMLINSMQRFKGKQVRCPFFNMCERIDRGMYPECGNGYKKKMGNLNGSEKA